MQARSAAAVLHARQTQSQNKPKLALGLSYMLIQAHPIMDPKNNGRDAVFPTISLQWPLYKRQFKSQMQVAQLRLRQAQQDIKAQSQMYQAQVQQSQIAFEEAQNQYRLALRQQKRQAQVLTLLMEAYTYEQAIVLDELLMAVQKQLSFENNAIRRSCKPM